MRKEKHLVEELDQDKASIDTKQSGIKEIDSIVTNETGEIENITALLDEFEAKSKEIDEEADEDGSTIRSFKNKYAKYAVSLIAISMTIYHIYGLVFKLSIPLTLYTLHWTFGLFLVFLLYPARKDSSKERITIVDAIFAVCVLIIAVYILRDPNALMYRSVLGLPTRMDLIFGAIAIVLSLEAARRTIGLGLPIVALVFLTYAAWGNCLPDILACKGYSWKRIIGFIFSTEGIFSAPVKMSAEYVFLLIVFGAFLNLSGTGEFFMKFAMAAAGKSRGGPAKVAVLSSALFGSISGSAVANVVGTGVFTIPLMKKTGYKSHFAGAVEAVASTGGQIMPPIMGSGAFIMAELIGWSYSSIALAALIPALLYYFSVLIAVDLEAAKTGLKGIDTSELEKPTNILLNGWNLIFPIIVLIYFLAVRQDSVSRAAIASIIAAIIGCAIKKETRLSMKQILHAMELGAIRSISIISAVACAGVAIGAIMLTGLGTKFTFIVSQIAGSNLLLTLIFSGLAATILGMGLPTVAAYIISASLLASGLIELGVTPICAHMFLLYYSILSQITPPVALAAYAAGNIAGANPNKVGFTAMRLGAIAFILPFFFVYGPALLMNGTPAEIIVATITAFAGTFCFSVAQYGWFLGENLNIMVRITCIVAALCMIIPGITTDIIGIFAITIALIAHAPVRKILKGLFAGKA